jgi:hypothetical protein
LAREEKIVIRVDEKTKNEFQTMAESLGMTMSALGSYLIGNYLKDERYKREMQMRMLEQFSPQMMDFADKIDMSNLDPRMNQTIADTIAHLIGQKPTS